MPYRLTGLFALIAALVAPLPAWSQAGRSGIGGTIFDVDKAVLPGVTVTITNEETGLTRTVVTDGEGHYVIPTLTPGLYSLAAELPGFQAIKRTGLRLAVGQELDLDMTMNVATVEEQVTVTAAAPVVETTSSRVGANVTSQEIDNMPSTGRNQLALMQLVPGLTPSLNPGSFEGGQFNANGRDTGSNLFMVDGVYNNDDRLGGSQGTQARIPLDVMAEYQVLTHQYTAEFGGSSGVVVNAVTKSGTNDLNGRVYYYGQDESLNQTDHFLALQNEENPPASTHIWGGNAGGPIVRNKAFWFASLERNMIDLGVSLLYPPEAAPLAESYTDTATIRAWNTFLRGDYQVTPNNHLSVRWVKEAAITFGEDWEDDLATRDAISIENDGNDAQYSGSWTAVIGGRATNELKFGHVREDLLQGGRPYFDDDFNFIELAGRDQFDIGSMNEHPDYIAGPLALHGSAKVRTWTINNDFTFIASGMGSHTFKAGFGWSENGSQPQIVGSNDNGTFEFLHNRPFNPASPFTYPSVFSIRLGEIYYDLTDTRWNGYVQDKWQVNNNLTLNLGLRYDYQEMTPNTKDAIAPRIGVAYDPMGDGKTVIRGGLGRFFEYQLNGLLSDLERAAVISPAFVFETNEDESPLDGEIPTSHVCLQPAGSNGLAQISPACRAFLENLRNQVTAEGFVNREPILDGDRRLGYLWSFSIGVQRELIPNLGLTVDYVGNRGRDQTGLIDINEPRQLSNGTFGRPGPEVFDPEGTLIPARARNTNFARVLQYQTRDDLNSDYNALEIGIDKRYSDRWSSRVSYTLARARDVGTGGGTSTAGKRFSDDLNPRSDYGLANFDNRHALAASLNVNPWRGLGAGAVFRYYSGYPINELVGSDVNSDRDNFDRPVAGVHDATRPIVSPLDEQGRAIRNGIDGENQVLLDLRFQYLFNLPREGNLGLFWEIFNATGRVNFGNPTGNRRSTNFLEPVGAGNMRSMQLGVRYSF